MVQPMTTKFEFRQNVILALGAVAIVCLVLAIVTGAAALILIGQPSGNAAAITADAFASVFSVAFFAAFILRMADELSHDS